METLAPSFKKLEYFHSRFKTRSSGKEDSIVTDPHAQPLYPLPLSIVKALYLFFVYSVGYWANLKDIRNRESLLLFDRYCYDLIVDPRRFRYGGPSWLARLISMLIPKPDLVILLDAPSDVLLARKQELPPEEVRRQCMAYRELIAALPNGYVADAIQPAERLLDDVSRVIGSYLQEAGQTLGNR